MSDWFTSAARSDGEEALDMLLDYADDFRRRNRLPADHPVTVRSTREIRDAIGDLPLPDGLSWGSAP